MKRKPVKLVKQKAQIDKGFLGLVLFFVFFGLLAIADASAPQALNNFGDKFYFLRQQAMWAVVGTVAMLVVSKIHYSFWEKIASPFFYFTVFLLVIVLLPNFGIHALGARRWIDLGFMSFQPSELIKFSLCIYLAKVAMSNKGVASYFVPLVLIVGLVMLQPDLGTTLIITAIGFAQIYLSGINIMYFVGALVTGAIATMGLILTSPYRKARLLTFFETTSDPLGKGYHIRQILLGLGSGGLFGVGLGQSRQKFLFLPEASTDSIFAIIGEEVGFVGSVILILLFLYLVIRIFKIAGNAPNTFTKIMTFGIGSWIGSQVFLNIASMVSLVPLTGIPLPFVSYGGSSLVTIMIACGIVLGISKYSTIKR